MEPHRAFAYPLNVLAHVLTLEDGGIAALHYGLFDGPDDSIASAQARSTDLIIGRLPPAPARILDVGAGLGGTLARLGQLGYDAEGITPDAAQLAVARSRHGAGVRVSQSTFEAFRGRSQRFDAIVFQESSQYIDAAVLFAQARRLTARVVVLDEFSMSPADAPGALHSLPRFLASASESGFRLVETLDLSASAAPTVDYFLARLPRHRDALVADIGVSAQQIDDLMTSGARYRDAYLAGAYVYRLLDFSAA
jgi:SAM-dependent methyltransferase